MVKTPNGDEVTKLLGHTHGVKKTRWTFVLCLCAQEVGSQTAQLIHTF